MSIDIAEVGSYKDTDDKIMMLEGFLGRDIPGQQAKGGGAQLVYREQLVEGPHFWVGPFFLKADRDGPYDIHVPVSKMRARDDYKKFGTWSMGQVQKLSLKRNATKYEQPGTVGVWYKKDGAFWSLICISSELTR